jgi:hypothetical protein
MTWLTQLFGAKDLVKEVMDGADKLFTSKGEKMELEIKLEQAISERLFKAEEMQAKDRADARDMNSRVQESENASWLAKNTAYLLDIGVFSLVVGIIIGLFMIEVPDGNKEIINLSVGTILGFLAATYTFHRGSSAGSKSKTDILGKLGK